MNPLTLVKRIQNITAKEASLGISDDASWHAKYKHSAYVYAGGLPFDLTEGDLLAVFAQYGEVVDLNLVRDKGTGKSKGFAFVAFEDQRSTTLAVDNLNGAQILGRIIRVDHVSDYKKKEEVDEETERRRREERGVCRAFQRGECSRGAACKFSHDEQRAANTGWGERDKEPKWGHDKFDGQRKGERRSENIPHSRIAESMVQEGDRGSRSRARADETFKMDPKQSTKREDNRLGSRVDGLGARARDRGGGEKSPTRHRDRAYQPKLSEDQGKRDERRHRKSDDMDDDDDVKPKSREEGFNRREEKRSRRDFDNDSVPKTRENLDIRDEKISRRNNDYDFERKPREEKKKVEERRLNRHDDSEFEPKSRAYDDKRDGDRPRRYDHDDVDPRTRDRKEDKRLSRNYDERFEPRSRDDNVKPEERKRIRE